MECLKLVKRVEFCDQRTRMVSYCLQMVFFRDLETSCAELYISLNRGPAS